MSKLLTTTLDRVMGRLGVAETDAGACIAPECEYVCYANGYRTICCYDCFGHLYCRPSAGRCW